MRRPGEPPLTAALPALAVARIRDTGAERVVLCGAVKAPEDNLPALLAMGVCESAFSDYAHRLVWSACVDLWGRWAEVSPLSVWWHLTKTGGLADLAGDHKPWKYAALWLAELWDEDPTGAWAVPAAGDVLRLAARRGAAHRAMEVVRDAIAGRGDREFYLGIFTEESVGQSL